MRAAEHVLARLVDSGILMQQDKAVPSVVTAITGTPLRGSWWSHAQGRVVFAVLSELAEHPDVLFTKLLFGKVTLVHRRLWPAVARVGMAQEPWQMRGLSPAARRALRELKGSGTPSRAASAVVRELDRRLLAVSREVHTAAGRHALVLEGWDAWCARVRCKPLRSAAIARRKVEAACEALGAPRSALPWPDDAES